MAETQNLTLRLDRDIIRRAKILAAQRGTSVSRLLAEYVEEIVGEEEAYQAASRRALELLEKGFHLGGSPATREALH